MKKILLTCVLVLMICLCHARPIIVYDDPKDDDKGGGNLRYPLADIFVPNAFDLKQFTVTDHGEYYEFTVEMWGKIITAPYGSRASDFGYRGKSGDLDEKFGVGPNGWIYQMIDIYLNFGNNTHRNALPGRNISFFKDSCWDKVILVTPENSIVLSELIRDNTETPGLQEMAKDMILPYSARVKGNRFIARIYRKDIPPITGDIGFQVFIMGYNSSFDRPSTLKTIRVGAVPSYREFSGEFSYCDGQPFIVDMLCPRDLSQFQLLSAYSCSTIPGKKVFAEVPMIWATAGQTSTSRQPR